jgi:pyruvate/2-oxoglutarate dehydrogenase complex dihydrolipoamide dehydrogenase (E3) component
LIEKKWIGGTCVNVGCTPTKTMIASGRVAYLVKRSADFGIRTTGFSVDIGTVISRKNEHVVSARESLTKKLLKTPNLDVLFGIASFTGQKEITVTREDGSGSTLTAENIFINAGARPVIPPIPGLSDIPFLTSSTIMDLLVIPSELVIIGGGYVSLEFGQLYRRLGSEVTILEAGQRFLPHEDPDIAGEIKKILEEDGIRIFTGAAVGRITRQNDQIILDVGFAAPVALATAADTAADVTTKHSFTASHVLVATGRMPDTEALNPAAAGIHVDKRGFISVDGRLETNVPGIYALGDVKGGPQFTHISYNDHLIIYENLVKKTHHTVEGRWPVYTLFTDPELGRIGLTETEAREKGLNIRVASMPAASIARAWENGEMRGLLKAIVDADTKTILGAAILSSEGGELMSVLQMAMMGHLTYDVLRDMVFAHPTFAECFNNLFMRLDQ